MKKMLLIFAALVFAAAAGAQPQPDLIARIHFAGAAAISADTNRLAFTNLFYSAEARALASQTLDKLSRAPGEWFKSKLPPGAGDGAAQLRPLLDDLLKSEWVFEMRDTTNGSPEYALAIRLNPGRARLWSNNLKSVFLNWSPAEMSPGKSEFLPSDTGVWGFRAITLQKLFRYIPADDWVMIYCGQGNSLFSASVFGDPKNFIQKAVAEETNWLTADLNWPRLAQIFPALAEFDFPKIQMQAVGRGGNLQVTGKLALAQPLPALEKWRLPASSIHQPLDSFTAARGIAPWLARQPWMQPFEIQPQPDQLFIWAMARIPFETFAAEPVPDAKAGLAQLDQRLSANNNWQGHFISLFKSAMTNDEISWRGLPFITPSVQAVRESAGDFLVGGFFPNAGQTRPLPPELSAAMNLPNLVYYHWEVTGERLKDLPQLSQLLLVLTRHEQVKVPSAAADWLDRIEPSLGATVTEVTQTAPNELAFKRTASGGLTAIELLALVDWLEAPQFPAFDLRLPPPRVRPGQKPFNPLSTPPVSPAPANP